MRTLEDRGAITATRRWRVLVRLRWWLLAAVAAAAAAAGWWILKPHEPTPDAPTAVVALADITQRVQVAGVLQARSKVDVGAQVSGQVKTLYVQLGQQVKKGDLLVSLDPELARSDVARAEAALGQQQTSLEARQVDLQAARSEVERQGRLLAGAATASLDLEKARNELAKLKADVRGQTAMKGRLQADLVQAQLRLGYTRITAPMGGTVVSLQVQEGQTLLAVQMTPVILTLADLDTMTVRVKVPEADIQSVKVGQTARFHTLADNSEAYVGKLRVVLPIPERTGNAVFYNVLFEVDNRSRRLFSDMTVQVEIDVGSVRQAVAVPTLALGERDKDGRFRVTVVDKAGQQETRQVRTGLQDGTLVQVLEGLAVGDTVLLAPPAAAPTADPTQQPVAPGPR